MSTKTTTQTTQQTVKNLEAAFGGESMANRKYLYFARQARIQGDEEVAKLFEATADEETQHAFAHLSQLYPPETLTVTEMLRLAMEGELYETTRCTRSSRRSRAPSKSLRPWPSSRSRHASRMGTRTCFAMPCRRPRSVSWALPKSRSATRNATQTRSLHAPRTTRPPSETAP